MCVLVFIMHSCPVVQRELSESEFQSNCTVYDFKTCTSQTCLHKSFNITFKILQVCLNHGVGHVFSVPP